MSNTAPVRNVIDNFQGVPAGSAGEIVAKSQSTVDTVFLTDTALDRPTAFGVPLVMDAESKARKFKSGDDGTSIKGALCRTDPDRLTVEGYPNPDVGHGRILRGAFLAVIAIGTPTRDAPVYVRTVADTGKLVGDLEATEAAGENIAVPGWTFGAGGKDADNIGVIQIHQ